MRLTHCSDSLNAVFKGSVEPWSLPVAVAVASVASPTAAGPPKVGGPFPPDRPLIDRLTTLAGPEAASVRGKGRGMRKGFPWPPFLELEAERASFGCRGTLW
jgi:hypothetical protein